MHCEYLKLHSISTFVLCRFTTSRHLNVAPSIPVHFLFHYPFTNKSFSFPFGCRLSTLRYIGSGIPRNHYDKRNQRKVDRKKKKTNTKWNFAFSLSASVSPSLGHRPAVLYHFLAPISSERQLRFYQLLLIRSSSSRSTCDTHRKQKIDNKLKTNRFLLLCYSLEIDLVCCVHLQMSWSGPPNSHWPSQSRSSEKQPAKYVHKGKKCASFYSLNLFHTLTSLYTIAL